MTRAPNTTKFQISEINSSVLQWEFEGTYLGWPTEFMVYTSVFLFVEFRTQNSEFICETDYPWWEEDWEAESDEAEV